VLLVVNDLPVGNCCWVVGVTTSNARLVVMIPVGTPAAAAATAAWLGFAPALSSILVPGAVGMAMRGAPGSPLVRLTWWPALLNPAATCVVDSRESEADGAAEARGRPAGPGSASSAS